MKVSLLNAKCLSVMSAYDTASDYLCSIKFKKVVTMRKVQVITNGIWAMVDKPRTAELMAKLFAGKVQQICRNNGVSSQSEERLVRNCNTLLYQLAYEKLSGERVDVDGLVAFIKVEFSDSLLAAAYSTDDGRSFIDELIHWVDNSFFDRFLVLFNRLGYQEFTSALFGIKLKLCRVRSGNRYAEYVV